MQDLDLLVADFLGGEGHRRLHRDVAEQLEHVVLDQVAQRPGLVVEAGAGADADVLGGGDLDGVDVVAVPERLEHAVGEAERHHVLDRLLAEVVVDAEDLRLLEHVSTWRLSSSASSSEVPNGFSMITRTSARRAAPAPLAELLDDQREEVGGGRQVEGAIERFPGLLVELVEHPSSSA